MSLRKRVSSDFQLENINVTDKLIFASNEVILQGHPNSAGNNTIVIDGNVTVLGTTTTLTSTDTAITDNIIILNSGETGAGVTAITSGIEIERGTLSNVSIRFNESFGYWEGTNDGTVWFTLDKSYSLVDDTNPTLGANLDVNDFQITNEVVNGNVVLTTNGTGAIQLTTVSGSIEIDPVLKMRHLTTELPIASEASHTKMYVATPSEGDSGLFVVNTASTDELVSKKRALLFSLVY